MRLEQAQERLAKDTHDENFVAAWLEGRLSALEKTRLIEHLADCLVCRGTLASLARAADLLARPATVWPDLATHAPRRRPG
jgi:predicted anti-sigma-YlaC factor YlaD